MQVVANGIDGRAASGPSRRPASGRRGASSESQTNVAIGYRLVGAPGDKFAPPYSGGAVVSSRPRLQFEGSGGSLGRVREGASRVAGSRGAAVCMGLFERFGLRGVSPSSPSVSGLGFRLRGPRKRSMIVGMRGLPVGGVASNKELERTRSTQTAIGPRRSIQCSTGIAG